MYLIYDLPVHIFIPLLVLDCQSWHYRVDSRPRHRGQEVQHFGQHHCPYRRHRHDSHRMVSSAVAVGFLLASSNKQNRPQEMLDAFKPDFVAPVVGYLTSAGMGLPHPYSPMYLSNLLANEESTGGIFEISGGWAAQTRWQRAGGHGFPTNKPLTPEDVVAKWSVITNFDDGRDTHPTTTSEALQQVLFLRTSNESHADLYRSWLKTLAIRVRTL